MVKSCLIFDEVAKLGKSTLDTYNWGGWLILLALLKNGVAEGVASDSHDKNHHNLVTVLPSHTISRNGHWSGKDSFEPTNESW